MSDLSSYQLDETATLNVRLPDGSPSDIQIELYHQHTPHYTREQVKILRATVESGADIEEQTVELLAACTKDWKNVEWEGEAVKFSREKAIELYSNPRLAWLRDQVDRFIHRSGNFLGNSKAD